MNKIDLTTNGVLIKKASGEEQLFSPEKLEQSLQNAGVDKETISTIVSDITNWIYPGVTTKKIYSRAFSMLKQEKTASTVRYKLKQAILAMGSTGYPFEILVGELFNRMGYDTQVGVVVDGNCITHEMDVIATREKIQHLVECKFHKDQGKVVSVQVPLYVRSRVDDIVLRRKSMLKYHDFSFKAWVVTNTRFSSDSLQYSHCSGISLLAWDYPTGDGLKENLEKYNIYPITVLENLTSIEKDYLLEKGIVTCLQLLNKLESRHNLQLNKQKKGALLEELKSICKK